MIPYSSKIKQVFFTGSLAKCLYKGVDFFPYLVSSPGKHSVAVKVNVWISTRSRWTMNYLACTHFAKNVLTFLLFLPQCNATQYKSWARTRACRNMWFYRQIKTSDSKDEIGPDLHQQITMQNHKIAKSIKKQHAWSVPNFEKRYVFNTFGGGLPSRFPSFANIDIVGKNCCSCMDRDMVHVLFVYR